VWPLTPHWCIQQAFRETSFGTLLDDNTNTRAPSYGMHLHVISLQFVEA
jgi:hypothetical protein